MYGKVEKGPSYTRFYVEFILGNGCTFYETCVLPNEQLKQYPKLYSSTLTKMTDKLKKRIDDRAL